MMKKNRFFLLLALAIMWAGSASAELLTGYVLLNGKQIPAEYTKLTNSTVALGSGFNACISQYSEGRINVPGTVKIGGTTYRVTEVKSLAFRLCSKITFINFEENITRIGEFACVGCNELDEIELPSTLESIGSGAFIDLPRLRSVVCLSTTPPRWEYNDVFNSIEGGIGGGENYQIHHYTDLSVPDGLYDAYKDASYSDASIGWTHPVGWKNFTAVNKDYLEDFRIYTPQDLRDLRDMLSWDSYPLIKKITLENDIDMTGEDSWNFGIGRGPTQAFQRKFDGHNHTITGLKIISVDETENFIGLFNYFAGDTIMNLRLKDCEFRGIVGVGALVGFAQTNVFIDNIYLDNVKVSGTYEVGGLIGTSNRASVPNIRIRNCVVAENCTIELKDNSGEYADHSTSFNLAIGGLIGFSQGADIKYCAVQNTLTFNALNLSVKSGPFIGTGKWSTGFLNAFNAVDVSYYAGGNFEDYYDDIARDNNIEMGDSIVIALRDTYPLGLSYRQFGSGIQDDEMHKWQNLSNMRTFFMAPYIGLDHWCYKMGEYPLPVPMEDFWEVEKNVMTLRPKNLPTGRVNGLSLLDENVPEAAWHNLNTASGDNRGIYYRNFTASRLWFDETIEKSGKDDPHMLPIGLGTITATDGIEYNRELRAKDIGVKYIEVPNFEYDEEKQEFVKGADGNPIETGTYTTFEDGRIFQPMGYSVYQPYTMKIPAFTKVYQPHSVKTDNGVTTVTFKEIDGDRIDAFTPYYVVVAQDTISLSTEAETICPPVTRGVVDLGDYNFVGSNEHLDVLQARQMNAYILQSDGKWHKVTAASPSSVYIPAFRSFFCSLVENNAKSLNMTFGDGDTPTDVQIHTIDRDGTERYYDLSGRLLNGMPTKRGIYIRNGKKIFVK